MSHWKTEYLSRIKVLRSVQGQGDVPLPWLQCTCHDHIEKAGKNSENREKGNKKDIN